MNISRKSKTALFLTTGVIAVLLAGCAGSQSAEEAGGNDDLTLDVFGPTATRQLLPRQTPEMQKDVQTTIFEGFAQENEDVSSVNWVSGGQSAASIQTLQSALLAQEPMDVIACAASELSGALVPRKLIKPIDESLIASFADRYRAASLDDYRVDGVLYGVPTSVLSTSTFYYNKKIFAEYGIPEQPTYRQLVAAVPKLEADGIIPVLHQGANPKMWPLWYFETFAQANQDPIAKAEQNVAGGARFDDAADVQAFAYLAQWVKDGILDRTSLGVDADGARAAFLNGDSAMLYSGSWEISQFEGVEGFDWGMFPFPSMPGAVGEPRHGGGADQGLCLAANIEPAKEAAAISFFEYLSRPDIATLYLGPEAPIDSSVNGVPTVDDERVELLRETTFPDTIKFLDWVWPAEVTEAYRSAIAGVVGGELTPEQAAVEIQKVADSLG